MKKLGRGIAGLGFLLAVILIAGCATTQDSSYQFANDPLASNHSGAGTKANAPTGPTEAFTIIKGNALIFSASDTPNPPAPIDTVVQDDGSVTLWFNEHFQADGKTIGALQQEIRARYVPKYFQYLTVTIKTQADRFYFVGGEVKGPGRQMYTGHINLLQAIDTAGGFTDFARKGKVQVTRANGKSFYVDCAGALTHPDLNCEIFPGDKVQVNRRLF